MYRFISCPCVAQEECHGHDGAGPSSNVSFSDELRRNDYPGLFSPVWDGSSPAKVASKKGKMLDSVTSKQSGVKGKSPLSGRKKVVKKSQRNEDQPKNDGGMSGNEDDEAYFIVKKARFNHGQRKKRKSVQPSVASFFFPLH